MRSAVAEALWEGLPHNEGTRIGDVGWLVEPAESFSQLFVRHYGRIRALREAQTGSGYVVAAVFANRTFAAGAFLTGTPDYERSTLIVGRHNSCGMCLDHDGTVALRHAVVRVNACEWGRPTVRVLDLRTGQGFVLDGAGRCDSVVGDGPLFLRVGSYALMFFPVEPGARRWAEDPAYAWAAFPPTILEDRRNDRWLPPRMARPTSGAARLTLLPPVTALEESAGRSQPFAPTVGRVTVNGPGCYVVRNLTGSELDQGVLLGRYGRCDLRLAALADAEKLSRVHLLLLKEGSEVLAIDTASSNGTTYNGRAFTAIRLGTQAVLGLAGSQKVVWERDGDRGGDRADAARSGPDPSPEPHATHMPPLSPAERTSGIAMGILAGAVLVSQLLCGTPPAKKVEAAPPTPAAQRCIDPMAEFGTDSAALRQYLYDTVPGVCFTTKWKP